MPAEILPNLALKAFYDIGESGWGDDMSLNLLKLSVLTQGGVLDKYAALPVGPVAGTVILLDETNVANPNKVAVFYDAAWVYFTPLEGWLLFNRAMNYFEKFDGVVWAELATGGGGGSLPVGGTTGQALVKQSNIDGDADWETISGGGSVSTFERKGVAFRWNGSNVIIDRSQGVSSVVRTALGQYRINFTTPFMDTFYTVSNGAAFDAFANTEIPKVGINRNQPGALVGSCDIIIGLTTDGSSVYDPGSALIPGALTLLFEGIGQTVVAGGGENASNIVAALSFNPSTLVVTTAFNATLTKNSVGDYTLTFGIPQPDTGYLFEGTGGQDLATNPAGSTLGAISIIEKTVNYVRFNMTSAHTSKFDGQWADVIVSRIPAVVPLSGTVIGTAGTYAARPAANTLAAGSTYHALDVAENYMSDNVTFTILPSGGNQLAYAELATEFAATAITDIPGMTVTCKVGENPVLFIFDGILQNDTTGFYYRVSMQVDGVDVGYAQGFSPVANAYISVHRQIRVDGLIPGSTHTFKFRLESIGGGTARIGGFPSEKASLSVRTT